MSTKEAPKSGHVETNLEVGQRAPGAVRAAATSAERKSTFGNSAIPEKAAQKPGIPEGYKPDNSVVYKVGKNGEPDTLHHKDGTVTGVSQESQANNGQAAMETLPKDHTNRDRVEAQARSLGVPVIEGETLEYLMWKIRMMASS